MNNLVPSEHPEHSEEKPEETSSAELGVPATPESNDYETPNTHDVFAELSENPDSEELAKLFPSSQEEIKRSGRHKKAGAGKGCLVILIILALIAGGLGVTAWIYRDKLPAVIELVQEYLGIEPEIDYSGSGHGELLFTITSGDYGSDIARNLVEQDIVMTEKAFLELLYSTQPEPVFYPGVYQVANQMSAEAALAALTDQSNRVEHTALLREGISYQRALEILSEVTEIPLEDFEAELADLSQFGIPAEAPSIEGYLFPATYTFAPDITAKEVISTLVNKMFSVLDNHGVAPEDRHEVLTMAALIQREAGSNPDDFYKVSRVFTNRLEQNWKLQSDATVHYGMGGTGTVWTTAADRADGSNLYNTYYHYGLPVGPIGLPGELAIDAALHPVDGPWMFFVTVDLRTGETAFSVTSSEHNANRNRLADWCQTPGNESYCAR